MNDNASNILQQVIEEMGGYGPFARRMGSVKNTTALREVAEGKRIPAPATRRQIVRASGGRISERDLIAITGQEAHDTRDEVHKRGVNPAWSFPEDDLRHWIWARAVEGARKQRLANRRRRG